MNDAHFHLVVNHLPIIFPLVGVIILVTGLFSKSEAVKRTAFMIFIFGGIAAIVAMSSGEGAEEVVENISGVSENLIKNHEETAETFALLSYVLGGLSVFGLWASFNKKTFSNVICIIVLIFALVVLFFAKQTGTTGGEIRHTEIRNGNNTTKDNKTEKEEND
ncbi:MAG TPA: hypothetical protein DCM02_10285 [Flavobacterium sp.]|nr:hypothetical protein [Flavobacterium sp.]